MAKWSGNKVNPEQINNGNEYDVNDNVSVEELNGIVNNSINAQKNSEEALKKANSAYEANGTLVKINGVNQTTWDATYAQKLTEESLNLYPALNLTTGYQWGNNGSSYADSNGWIDSTYYEIEPGTAYYTLVNQNVSLYDANKTYISSLWYVSANGFTTPSNAKYYRIGGNITSSPQSTCMLTKGIKPSEYYPFNQKSHITNSEAEFLKDEHNKSLNLISEEIIKIEGFNIIWGYIYGLKPNTTYTFKTYAGYIGGSNLKLETQDGTLVQDVVTDWSLNLQNQVAKITTGNNVSENGMYRLHLVGTYSDSTVTRDCILVEGDYTFSTMPSYIPYNSASHITNGQADLLRNEHEKSINLYHPYKNGGSLTSREVTCTLNEDGTITLNGTATSSAYFEFIYGFLTSTSFQSNPTIQLDKSKTYSINIYKISGTATGSWRISNQLYTDASENNIDFTNSSTTLSKTFSNSNGVYRGYITAYEGVVFDNFKIGIVVNEGTNRPNEYTQYNSSSHITNGQAKSLISIYEKWVNALHLPKMEETRISGALCSIEKDKFNINGTLTSNFWLSLVLPHPVPAGNYYFKVFNANGLAPSYFGFIFYDKDGNSLGSYDARFKHSKPITFDKEVAKIGFGANSGSTFNNFSIEIMFAKDNIEPSRFYEWNGDPIFTKDLEPVLLWENGSPNADFANTTLNIDLSKFSKIRVGFKITKTPTNAVQYMDSDLINETQSDIYLSLSTQSNTYTRQLYVQKSNNTIAIGAGSVGEAVGNNACIPVAIYGLYY